MAKKAVSYIAVACMLITFFAIFIFSDKIMQKESLHVDIALSYGDGYYENVLKSGEQLTVTAFVSNKNESNRKIYLFTLLYSKQDDKIVNMSSAKGNTSALSNSTLTCNMILPADNIDNFYVRAFVWDAMSSTPITAERTISNAQPDYYGNTLTDAANVMIDKNIRGNIDTSEDADFIKITPKESGYYDIRADGIELLGVLYDKESEKLVSHSGISTRSRWSYSLTAGESYVFKLYSEKIPGEYNCSITLNTEGMEVIPISVNSPVLPEGLTPVYWEGENLIVEGDQGWNGTDWFSYEPGDNRWANGVLKDGSMFVWIPRYAYRLEENLKTIDVKFLNNKSDTAYDGTLCKKAETVLSDTDYIIHPAFTVEGEELAGLWIAKYEASSAEGGTDGGGNDGSKNIQFKPNTPSWRGIDLKNIIQTTESMGTNVGRYGLQPQQADVHLIKNSEWGAAAYLAYASLDNGNIEANTNDQYLTGGGNYIVNGTQSTTGNVYGIYDMAGGAYEYVAGHTADCEPQSLGGLAALPAKYKDVVDFNSPNDVGQALSETVNFKGNHSNPSGRWGVFLRGHDNQGAESAMSMFSISGEFDRPASNMSWRAAMWITGGSYAHPPASDKYNLTPMTESAQLLDNPYHGFMVNSTGSYNFKTKIATSLVYWSELEPVQGQIDFDYLENKLGWNRWRNEGAVIVPRIIMDYPHDPIDDHMEIPAWLYDLMNNEGIGRAGTWYREADAKNNGRNFQPNYENPLLIDAHRSMLERLAERYNDDPLISFIQLGSLGRWGEWNTQEPLAMPNTELADKYVNPYTEYFYNKRFLMRNPHILGKKYGFGLYDDMIGYENSIGAFLSKVNDGYTDGNNELQPHMRGFWRNSVSSGEFGTKIENGLSVLWYDQPYIESTIRQLKQAHTSFFGASYNADEISLEQQENINRILKTVGYRLWVSGINYDSSTDILTIGWKNSGCAPFYFDWDAEISIIDQNDRIVYSRITNPMLSKCLPDRAYIQKIKLGMPAELLANYKIGVAIISPHTNKPGLELANTTARADMRYVLPYTP